VAHEGQTVLAKGDAAASESRLVTLLELHQLGWLCRKRSGQGEEVIAIGSFRFWVAAVESLGPDQRCRLAGRPGNVTGTGEHAFDGHTLGAGLAGNVVFHFSVAAPDLDLLREIAGRDEVAVRAHHARDKDVLAVRR